MGWTSQFVLENENGDRFGLTAPAPVYMTNVEGLGVSVEDGFGDVGNGFFLVTNTQDPRNGLTADLVYQAGAYSNYKAFVDWLHKAKSLYFCYTPIETEYRRRVRLKTLQKAMRDGTGWMTAMISFEPLTPWYATTEAAIEITPLTGNVKGYFLDGNEYGYVYDSNLHYGSDSAGDMSAEIAAAGHIPAAFVLRYTGAVENPEIRLVGQETGKIYGVCSIGETFSATDTLELSTVYGDSHVWKISAGGTVTDLLDAVDITQEIYPHAPTTEKSVLSITSDSTMTGSASGNVFYYYRSV